MEEEIRTKLRALYDQPRSSVYKTINSLVSSLEPSECISNIISSLDYNDSYESLLKIKLVDKFQIAKCVVDILKSENPHLLRCALQFNWFFEGGNDVVNVDYFATNVFPHTSVLTRRKIIKQFSLHLKYENVAENFFNFVRMQYGLSQAVCLLKPCSLSYTSSFINSTDVILTSDQLISLFKKSQDVAFCYLSNYCKQFVNAVGRNTIDYRRFILFVAHEHPASFIRLCKILIGHIPYVHIGRRSTKKIIQADKSLAIDFAHKVRWILEQKHIHKYFTIEEFEMFYSKIFPESISSIHYEWDFCISDWFTLIQGFPDEIKVKLILNIFRKKYDMNLLDRHELITEKFLKILPSEEKYRIGKKRYDEYKSPGYNYESRNHWICYLPLDQSIPVFKELLNEATTKECRMQLVSCLVVTCHINDSISSLLDVLKYFLSRFRNDDVTIRTYFIQVLSEEFDLLKLTEEHWDVLYELLQISIFNKEILRQQPLEMFLEKYICYCIITSSPNTETAVRQFIKIRCQQLNFLSYSYVEFLLSESKYQKQCLIIVCNLLPSIHNFDSLSDSVISPLKSFETLNDALAIKIIFCVLKSLHKWNIKHKNNQISVVSFPWLVSAVSRIMQSDNKGVVERLVPLIYSDRCLRETLFSLLLVHALEPRIVIHFLNTCQNCEEPVISNIFDYMVEKRNIERYKTVLRKLITSRMLKMCNLFRIKCKDLVQKNMGGKFCNALYIMSFIDPDAFLTIVKNIYPSDSEVNFFEEGGENLFSVQKMAAKSLLNVKPFLDLETVVPFCQGDYLKLVLGSLYSVSMNAAEIRVKPFLRKLSEKPTSVKKHALTLLHHVLGTEEAITVISQLLEKENHTSIRKVLLRMIIQIFSIEPTEENFSLLKLAINSVTARDKISFSVLTIPVSVPHSYRSELFQLFWNVLMKLDGELCNTKSYCIKMLEQIVDNLLDTLPDNFFNNLFLQFLFEPHSKFHYDVERVCCFFLLRSKPNVVDSRVMLVSNLLKEFISQKWEYKGMHDESLYPGRDIVFRFIQRLCTYCFNVHDDDDDDNADDEDKQNCKVSLVLNKFISHYISIVGRICINCYLILKLYYTYFACKDKTNLKHFGKEVSIFIDTVISEHGPLVVPLITRQLNEVVENILGWLGWTSRPSETLYLELVSGLIFNSDSPHCMLAGIELLPNKISHENQKEKLKEILTCLHDYCGKDKSLVQVYLNEKNIDYDERNEE